MNSARKTIRFLYLGETFSARRMAFAAAEERSGRFAWWARRGDVELEFTSVVRSRKIYIHTTREHPPRLYPWQLNCELINPCEELHETLAPDALLPWMLRQHVDSFIYAINTTERGWEQEVKRGALLAAEFQARTGLRPCLHILTDRRHTSALERRLEQMMCELGCEEVSRLVAHMTARRKLWPALWHEIWSETRRLISDARVELAAAE